MAGFDASKGLAALEMGEKARLADLARATRQRVGGLAAAGNYRGAAAEAYKAGDITTGAAMSETAWKNAKRGLDIIGRLAVDADTPEKWNAAIGWAKQNGLTIDGLGDFGSRRFVLRSVLDAKTQLDAMKPRTVSPGSALIDPRTGREIYKAPFRPDGPKAVAPGTTLVDPATGKEVYRAQPKATQPRITDFYDEKTGLPYKGYLDPKTGQIVRLGGTKAPTGTRFEVGKDGTVKFSTGVTGGKKSAKGLTETQAKAATYSVRAVGANKTLNSLDNELAGFANDMAARVPLVGNYLTSEKYKKATNAALEFLQAILRKDSGAAITAEEVEQYGAVYLPSPGDTADVVAQKRAARARAIAALEAGMTPDAILAKEKALSSLPKQAPKTIKRPGPTVGDIVEGHRFVGGDPHDKKNWVPIKIPKLKAPKAMAPSASAMPRIGQILGPSRREEGAIFTNETGVTSITRNGQWVVVGVDKR